MTLTEAQVERYSRQILLPEIGGTGQLRLLEARVLLVGAGAVGSACATYLAAAGVGRLGLVDGDVVELSNLHRQTLYGSEDVGHPKVEAARKALVELDPDCRVEAYPWFFDERSGPILRDYDVVVDSSDSFSTKFLLNDLCVRAGKPFVTAAVLRFDAQIGTFAGHEPGVPCYRCLFPEPPPRGLWPEERDCGAVGPVGYLLGALAATEVLKSVLGVGRTLEGRLLVCDALGSAFREVPVRKDPECPVCSGGNGRSPR
ncbi:MAG: molybdopterin biosynthesis protein [Candidatus Binatia bacterium]|nr:MAG: molybdopterin biosynthesis protein [Candidatus Binatia bacterium]